MEITFDLIKQIREEFEIDSYIYLTTGVKSDFLKRVENFVGVEK